MTMRQTRSKSMACGEESCRPRESAKVGLHCAQPSNVCLLPLHAPWPPFRSRPILAAKRTSTFTASQLRSGRAEIHPSRPIRAPQAMSGSGERNAAGSRPDRARDRRRLTLAHGSFGGRSRGVRGPGLGWMRSYRLRRSAVVQFELNFRFRCFYRNPVPRRPSTARCPAILGSIASDALPAFRPR